MTENQKSVDKNLLSKIKDCLLMHSGGVCKKCTPSCIAAVFKISPGGILGEKVFIWDDILKKLPGLV